MRLACLLAAILILPTSAACAQTPTSAPPYQRMRPGADNWQSRGGAHQHWRGGGNGPGAYGGGFYNPYFAPPIVAGSYYERPYPYHFDYYRGRWSAPQLEPGAEMMPVSDCPCRTPASAASNPTLPDAEPPT